MQKLRGGTFSDEKFTEIPLREEKEQNQEAQSLLKEIFRGVFRLICL